MSNQYQVSPSNPDRSTRRFWFPMLFDDSGGRAQVLFVLECLVLTDFRVRYRNMSLGVFWSILNPLVMIGLLTFVLSNFFPNPVIRNYPLFLLCGLIPFNFFTICTSTGTNAITGNSTLIKRLPVAREVFPLAAVLSNFLHLLIQIAILVAFVAGFGYHITSGWLWLPYIWAMQLLFLIGIAFIVSSMNVFIRDTRYITESLNSIMFWLVPIVYPLSMVPSRYAPIYQYNPITALILAMRTIIIDGHAPTPALIQKLSAVAIGVAAIGWLIFRRLKPDFSEYL